MKTKIILALTALSIYAAQAQTVYKFRKPTFNSGAYKFTSVKPGVDAYITVIGSKNATLDQIDDSSSFKYAWNPFIKINKSLGSNDTAYIEFLVEFKKSNNLDTQSEIIMTVVDCDGSGKNSYREMVQTPLPAIFTGYSNTDIIHSNNNGIATLLSGEYTFNSIDTISSHYPAMAEIKYKNKSFYKVKIGVIGKLTLQGNNTLVRQFSFYFKNFGALLIPLPIKEVIKRKDIKVEDEEPIQIFNFYGKMVFEGGYKDFLKNYAEDGEIYITSKGYKFIKE